MSTPKPVLYLSTTGFAERLGIKPETLRSYLKQGRLPEPDALIGAPGNIHAVRGWLPETIDEWNKNRPGRGARTDLQK